MRWSPSAICCALSLAACTTPPAVIGESWKPKVGELWPTSPLYQGGVVRLRGARGETLGLQAFAKEGGHRLVLPDAVARVDAFRVHALNVTAPSTSMYGPSRGTGRYPDRLEPATGAAPLPAHAFFDVAIRPGAKPGRYRGELRLGLSAVPVELTVEPVTIDVARDPLVWVFYLPRELARAHGLPDDDGEAQLALEAKYQALFRAHGCYLASDQPPARFASRKAFLDGVRYWPVSLDTSSDERTRADVAAWLALFKGLSQVPFAIPVDEPRTPEDRARTRHILEVMGEAGGRAPALLRAVTAAPHPDFADAVDVYVSPNAVPTRPGSWTYNGRPPQAGSLILDTDGAALRSWGLIAQRYRVPLWYAWEGLYWSDRYNRGGPTDVMTQPITFDERKKGGQDHGNGDGVLAYPSLQPSLRLKALRRGLQDRLLLQRLLACGGGVEAEQLTRQLVPRALAEGRDVASWPSDERSWEEARNQILDALVARCPDV